MGSGTLHAPEALFHVHPQAGFSVVCDQAGCRRLAAGRDPQLGLCLAAHRPQHSTSGPTVHVPEGQMAQCLARRAQLRAPGLPSQEPPLSWGDSTLGEQSSSGACTRCGCSAPLLSRPLLAGSCDVLRRAQSITTELVPMSFQNVPHSFWKQDGRW